MKDEDRIVSNTLITYAAKLITGAIGFVMVPYLIRSLGEETYGVMGICWSILGLLLLVEAGVRPALVRQFTDALARGEVGRSNAIASSALGFYLAVSAAIVGVLALGAGRFLASMRVPAGLESEASIALVLVGLAAALGLVAVPFNTVLQSLLRHDVQNYLAVAKSASTALVIVALFELSRPRLVAWAAVEVGASVLMLWAYVWQAHRRCPSLAIRSSGVSRRGFGEIASFGAYTVLLGATGWISMQSGPMVISYFLGTAAVAHYTPVMAVVATLVPLQLAFLAPLQTFLTRAHAQGDWGAIGRVLVRSTRYSLLLTGGAVVLLASVSAQAVPLWLGGGFEDTAVVLVLWCAALLLQASAGASYGVFIGTGRVRRVTVLNVALAAFSLGIGVALLARTSLGVAGVAWGMLAGQAVRALSFLLYATSLCGMSRGRYLREAFLGPALCLAALAGACLAAQRLASAAPLVEVAAAAGAGALVFAPLVWRVGLAEADRAKAAEYAARVRLWLASWRARGGAGTAD